MIVRNGGARVISARAPSRSEQIVSNFCKLLYHLQDSTWLPLAAAAGKIIGSMEAGQFLGVANVGSHK